MRGKPGHRTAPSLEWREKMPRSERRDRKTCLCWKAFTLTHLYEDIKKNPSAIRAGGWATARCTARPRCQLSSCCREKKASRWPSGWRDSIGPPCPTTSVEVKASSQLGEFVCRDSQSLLSYSLLGSVVITLSVLSL